MTQCQNCQPCSAHAPTNPKPPGRPKRQDNPKRLHVGIPGELYDALVERCAASGLSLSSAVDQALNGYLARQRALAGGPGTGA